MPELTERDSRYQELCSARAHVYVSVKYPHLKPDSPAWWRAFQARYRRLLRTH